MDNVEPEIEAEIRKMNADELMPVPGGHIAIGMANQLLITEAIGGGRLIGGLPLEAIEGGRLIGGLPLEAIGAGDSLYSADEIEVLLRFKDELDIALLALVVGRGVGHSRRATLGGATFAQGELLPFLIRSVSDRGGPSQ